MSSLWKQCESKLTRRRSRSQGGVADLRLLRFPIICSSKIRIQEGALAPIWAPRLTRQPNIVMTFI